MSNSNIPMLEVRNLKKYFPVRKGLFRKVVGHVKAVDGVSFRVDKGNTLGIVGESGCGKSTVARVIMRVLECTDGEIFFDGKDVLKLKSPKELKQFRRDVQIIFQDPYASLNPRMTISKAIGEVLEVHGLAKDSKNKEERIKALLSMVDLAENDIYKYPHEFSGGQRQRIGIARALSVRPRLVICDEPVSALDASIQAQILNLMDNLKREFELTYVFISHDLAVIKHISDKVAVMYLGRIVEVGEVEELFSNPLHPYTKALLAAIPVPDPNIKRQPIIFGDVPSPINIPSGCRFHPRCSLKTEICAEREPLISTVNNNHAVACHLYDLM